MGDHDYQSTCISAEPHESATRDHLQHFFGCLEFRERRNFFSHENPIWRSDPEPVVQPETGISTPNKRWDSFQACLDQLRRIEYLRKAVRRDKEKDNDLDSNITQSKSAWKKTAEYKAGIAAIKKWKDSSEYKTKKHSARNWEFQSDIDKPSPTAAELQLLSSTLFPSMKGGVVTSKDSEIRASRSTINIATANGSNTETKDHAATKAGGATDTSEEYDPEKDLNAYIVQFEADDNHSYHRTEEMATNIRSLKGHFPDQRVSVATLLGETPKGDNDTMESARKTVKYGDPEVNFLDNARDESCQRIRWFHLPANNMAVSIRHLPFSVHASDSN